MCVQLREQLQTSVLTHSGELDGVRTEVSKLMEELHQRDLTIAALSSTAADTEQRLSREMERAECTAAEFKVRERDGSS